MRQLMQGLRGFARETFMISLPASSGRPVDAWTMHAASSAAPVEENPMVAGGRWYSGGWRRGAWDGLRVFMHAERSGDRDTAAASIAMATPRAQTRAYHLRHRACSAAAVPRAKGRIDGRHCSAQHSTGWDMQ